jgi:hypothetical protein
MIIVRTKKLKNYLTLVNRTEEWLAGKICKKNGEPISKYYLSLIINNHCQVSDNIKEQLIEITNMRFEDLFALTGSQKQADFMLTGEVFYEGQVIPKRVYVEKINKKKA